VAHEDTSIDSDQGQRTMMTKQAQGAMGVREPTAIADEDTSTARRSWPARRRA